MSPVLLVFLSLASSCGGGRNHRVRFTIALDSDPPTILSLSIQRALFFLSFVHVNPTADPRNPFTRFRSPRRMEFNLNVIKDDSPFPEVRASVSNSDEPTMYAMTIRMWFVGLFLCSVTWWVPLFFVFFRRHRTNIASFQCP